MFHETNWRCQRLLCNRYFRGWSKQSWRAGPLYRPRRPWRRLFGRCSQCEITSRLTSSSANEGCRPSPLRSKARVKASELTLTVVTVAVRAVNQSVTTFNNQLSTYFWRVNHPFWRKINNLRGIAFEISISVTLKHRRWMQSVISVLPSFLRTIHCFIVLAVFAQIKCHVQKHSFARRVAVTDHQD